MIKKTVNELVSIIVPVYNTPQYKLEQTIQTLMNQTYHNLEIIFIDDGSNKETHDYLDKIVLNLNSRMIKAKVYHLENGGVSKARNYGISKASGTWICFVDSDDMISRFYIEILLKSAIEAEVPIASCGFKKISDPIEMQELDNIDYKMKVYYKEDVWKNVNTGYVWNKIYRKDIINSIEFDEGKTLAEDFLFVNQVFEKNPVCAVSDKILYWYLINPYSSTSLLSSKQCKQAIDAYEYGLNIFYIKNNINLYNSRLLGQVIWMLRYIEALENEKHVEARQEYIKVRLFCKRVVGTVKMNSCGLYERMSFYIITKFPMFIGVIYLKLVRRVRIMRLNFRKIKNENSKK